MYKGLLGVCLLLSYSFACCNPETDDKQENRIQIPVSNPNCSEQVIEHFAYTVSYNPDWRIPNWVAYELTYDHVKGPVRRTNDFREDSLIMGIRPTLADYNGSGYARGHMAPAGDMKWDKQAMSESFLLSNICPQESRLNDGKWNNLENSIRKLAAKDSAIYIVCGPIVTSTYYTIGEHHLVVPDAFFKVLCKKRNGNYQAIGFIMPNQNIKGSIFDYAVPVDKVEEVTGIDFFHLIPDEIEAEMERAWRQKDWQ